MEFMGVVKQTESKNDEPRKANPDEYARSVSKIAVAQVCEGVGFEGVKQSALDALSNIAVLYICDVGKFANSYASLACRTECNVFDVVKGLEKSGCTSVVKEISEFVGVVEDMPFAQQITRFPVVKTARLIPSFYEMGEIPSGKHIPDWLPAFPDRHTYVHSRVWNERKKGKKDKKGKQRRKAERAWMNLQQRLLSHGSEPCSSSPLPCREKDASMVVLPVKFNKKDDGKHLSVLETFASVIDASKGGVLDVVDRRVAPERRTVVYFKYKAGKKMLIEDLDVHLRNRGNVRKQSWFRSYDEKDNKKRRVKEILLQSSEHMKE